MISGGRETVVVVVVVTTVCCVAGPKHIEATVELGGGIIVAALVDGVSLGCEVKCLWCGISSVGDAGAVDRIASAVSGAGAFTSSPSPSVPGASILHGL